jgi:arylsulfatase A-like enzyme
MVSSLDLFPTVLAAAGAKVDVGLDGVDLLPFLTAGDSRPIRRTHYWRVGAQAAFIQDGWKIHRVRGDKATQLYHLAEDPGEAHDLAAEHPDRVAEMEAAWRELDAGMVDPLWGGPIRKAF